MVFELRFYTVFFFFISVRVNFTYEKRLKIVLNTFFSNSLEVAIEWVFYVSKSSFVILLGQSIDEIYLSFGKRTADVNFLFF